MPDMVGAFQQLLQMASVDYLVIYPSIRRGQKVSFVTNQPGQRCELKSPEVELHSRTILDVLTVTKVVDINRAMGIV